MQKDSKQSVSYWMVTQTMPRADYPRSRSTVTSSGVRWKKAGIALATTCATAAKAW